MSISAAPRVLFAGRPAHADDWLPHLTAAADEAGLTIDLSADPAAFAPGAVDYLLYAPTGSVPDLSPYTGLKGVLSLWAGVETIVGRTDFPPDTPLVRMVEPGLTEGMTDYVVAHALRYHMDLDGTLERSRAQRWDEAHPPLSRHRRIGILGLGVLGRDAAEKLAALRFQVTAWSRSPKTVPGVECRHGDDGLAAVLPASEILIVLLPQTPETVGLLDAERLALLPRGAFVINVARGPILPETDLLAALDGHLGGATLDVFDQEPLPEEHPYWRHDKVTVTPHIASVTRPETASKEVVRQIALRESGRDFDHVVDITRGY